MEQCICKLFPELEHWNRGIYTMVAIISIRMGDMIGHSSWAMSWLAAHGVIYLPA